jgi:branched-chain amino acid transport system permease protein
MNSGAARLPWLKDGLLRLSPASLILFAAIALVPVVTDDIYFVEILLHCVVFSLIVMSWDILGGYCAQPNFGHAFFVGGAAYAAGFLSLKFKLPPVLLIPAAGLLAGLFGLGIGYLTLRLKGPYFALATMVANGMLFKLVYILHSLTGGEEGLSGIPTITDSPLGDLYVCLTITLLCYLGLSLYTRSKYGLILRSSRFHVADAAEASGINTAYYKVLAFVISGCLAGVGGGLLALTTMHVGPSLVDGGYSVDILLFAMVGGSGTIVGPLMAGFLLSLLLEWLRIVDTYRHVILLALLFLLFYFQPDGLLNISSVKRSKVLKRLFFGRDA